MKVLFVRHGATCGNINRRYIGRTNESLSTEGREQVRRAAVSVPRVGRIFVSPMLRCRETADILFPGQTMTVVNDLREVNFGDFEGRTHAENMANPAYKRWLDSGGVANIPNGEGLKAFKARVTSCLFNLFASCAPAETVAVVAHGGVVAAAMAEFGRPPKPFWSWLMPNAGWIFCEWDNALLTLTLLSDSSGGGSNPTVAKPRTTDEAR